MLSIAKNKPKSKGFFQKNLTNCKKAPDCERGFLVIEHQIRGLEQQKTSFQEEKQILEGKMEKLIFLNKATMRPVNRYISMIQRDSERDAQKSNGEKPRFYQDYIGIHS